MADITTEAEFLALKWHRGIGYYGANKHAMPYSWRDFRHNMGLLSHSMQKARYEAYVLSWILFHKKEPEADRLDEKHGETILANVRAKVREALELQQAPVKKGRKKA